MGITDTDGFPLDIKEKMDAYVLQRGFPLVTVDRQPGGEVDLIQTYFINPPDQQVPDDSEWG